MESSVIGLASAEGVTAVAATWLLVRMLLPHLRAINIGESYFLEGTRRTWIIVFAAAFAVSYVAARTAFTGEPGSAFEFDLADLLRDAAGTTVLAIGADNLISRGDPDDDLDDDLDDDADGDAD